MMQRQLFNLLRGRVTSIRHLSKQRSKLQLHLQHLRPCTAVTFNLSLNAPHSRHFSSSNCTHQNVSAGHDIMRSHIPDLDIPDDLAFHEFIFQRCDVFKDKVALEEFVGGKTCSFSQLKASSLKVASALHKLGLRKGDVALVFSTNCVDFTILMLACSRLGVWFSPANPTFTADELCHQLNHGGATSIFTHNSLADTASQALDKGKFTNISHRYAFGEASGFEQFDTLLEDDGNTLPDLTFDPAKDVLTLPYSSGTTGLPKGVMLTHHSCLANILQTAASVKVEESDRALGLLPLYHIYGMMVVQYGVLVGGGTMVYLPKFEPETFLQCLQDKKITLAHLVPPLIVFMAKSPMCAKYDVSSIRLVVCGAAPLGADITAEFRDKYKHVAFFGQGYGLTETSPVTNIDTSQTLGCAGNLVANTFGKIVDLETGATLGPHQEGEYVVKGPQVMKGYFNNQKATDDMLAADGWMSTGDIGCFDEEGKLYIKDRLKELIKYKGSQVPPAELEALLLGHPDIADVAVIGRPDLEAGELPLAFVVKSPGSQVTEDDIVTFVKERVRPTMRLRGGVKFIEAIPKNPSGKILRRILKSQYL